MAEWIWCRPPRSERAGLIPRGEPDFTRDENLYVYFRKSFFLGEAPASRRLRVSADGRYILYVNGRLVGRGPARCHPGWQYADPYDLAPYLVPGKNVVAALVHSYGRDCSWYQLPRGRQALLFGCAGFYLEYDTAREASAPSFSTDASWRFLVSEAWDAGSPFGGPGFAERYDEGKSPGAWESADFDDSSWKSACVQRIPFKAAGTDAVPFPRLVDRDIDVLGGRYAKAERILPGGYGGLGIWDFGRILFGRLRLEAEGPGGAGFSLSVSESLDSAGRLHIPGQIAAISSPLSHEWRLAGGRSSHLFFEAGGFRYLRLEDLDTANPARILSVGVEESFYPGGSPLGRMEGAFACSDPLLTQIWEAGAYTASLCRQDGFMDCPSREQRQWNGDAGIQSLLGYVVSSDTRLARKSLVQAAQTQQADGMIAMASASDLGAQGRTFIPDYAFHWILAIENYLLHAEDGSIAEELFPSVAKAIEWFSPYIDDRGLLSDVPGWVFLDWSDRLDREGEVLALNALFSGALEAASRLAEAVGASGYAARWRSISARLRSEASEGFWDAERELYADARRGDRLSPILSQQANAAAIVFGIAPPERWDSILDAIMDESRLALTRTWRWDIERPFDPERNIILAQPFFCHFLHAALARAGRKDLILKNIRERWSPMLEEGNTFWESWQMTEMTSRCHAFSATPLYDLPTHILGIAPGSRGYASCIIRPHFAGLDWAKGKVPTPRGAVEVGWRREGPSIDLEIEAPAGLEARLEFSQGCGARVEPRYRVLAPGKSRFRLEAL